MREVIYRRYSRVIKDNLQFPDLIIVDGGKGQINAAKEVLDNQLGLDIPIAGLAKDDKHNTSELIFRVGDIDEVIHLDRRSEAFFLLQRMQDEVHRFVITFFKKTHQRNSLTSILENVPGLGPKRRKLLLTKYKSITAIANASVEELHQLKIPTQVAEDLLKYLEKY